MISKFCNQIFEEVITDYHLKDNIDQAMQPPYKKDSFEYLLYSKCWIDNVQWHMEDLIRNPSINSEEGMRLKRRIDKSNQNRTDVVEIIDDYFFQKYANVVPIIDAKINSESPAWIIDRLSILALKIFHMKEETLREDVSITHRNSCIYKLHILESQKKDLCQSLDEFIDDIKIGHKYMKVYKQMKMYNDPALNPVFYNS